MWIPVSIWDLDKCNHLNLKYEPSLDAEHPGFFDMEYRKRREDIANIAFTYKCGDPIPRINYTSNEINTWRMVYKELKLLFPTHACREHIKAFKMLEKKKIFRPDSIPQLQDVSAFLKKTTGFQLRPVAGLVTPRDFLASLAFKVFQCTQYVRHSSSPFHTPEPDCIHELLGHIPLLGNPTYAEFIHQIGLASLGASDEEIEKFSTIFWFTVEFGLCKEDDYIKAYGAGLLSAYGELKHSLSGLPELREFNLESIIDQKYTDDNYQKTYFVADSLEKAKEKIKEYSNKIDRPFEVEYNSLTQSVSLIKKSNYNQLRC